MLVNREPQALVVYWHKRGPINPNSLRITVHVASSPAAESSKYFSESPQACAPGHATLVTPTGCPALGHCA